MIELLVRESPWVLVVAGFLFAAALDICGVWDRLLDRWSRP